MRHDDSEYFELPRHARDKSAPRFVQVVDGLNRYRAERTDLTNEQKLVIHEILWRVDRLEREYARLVRTNDELFRRAAPEVYRDEPEWDPFSFANLTHGYSVGTDDPFGAEGVAELQYELEASLEGYYYAAFRLQSLVQTLPGERKFGGNGITIVRNKLVEHFDAPGLNSFGFGRGGPFIRPLQGADAEHRDQGLVANTEELVRELERRFPLSTR